MTAERSSRRASRMSTRRRRARRFPSCSCVSAWCAASLADGTALWRRPTDSRHGRAAPLRRAPEPPRAPESARKLAEAPTLAQHGPFARPPSATKASELTRCLGHGQSAPTMPMNGPDRSRRRSWPGCRPSRGKVRRASSLFRPAGLRPCTSSVRTLMSRTGSKGTPRVKQASKPKASTQDDTKVQAALKKLPVQAITGIEVSVSVSGELVVPRLATD